jgi:hypothetical protein
MKPPRFSIRTFAVICVAVTSAYVMWLGNKVNDTLSGPGWCRTALGAEKASATDGTIKGLDACVGLLTIQLKSLSTNSHILLGTIALCLAVLIIIVVAGARFSGEAPGGWKADVSRQDAPAAAQAVADSAQTTADTIKDIAPAMPEPKP